MILYRNFKETGLSDRLLAYQQAGLDIAAYNSALLETSAPSAWGVEGEKGETADTYYWAVRENARDWAEVIVPHCRIVPQTILHFSFSSYMEIVQQSLDLLVDDPQDMKIRGNLSDLLEEISGVMASCQKDTEKLREQVDEYCQNTRKNIDGFQAILDAVTGQIQVDEAKKKEILGEIQEARTEMAKASARLEADRKALSKKWFIVLSIVALGIPLLVVAMDEIAARKAIENERKRLNAYEHQLDENERLLSLLYGAQKTYADLKENTKELQTAAQTVADIWKDVADTCKAFADLLRNEKTLCDRADFVEAKKEIAAMTASWEALKALAEPLSTFTYEVKVEKETAA